MNVRVKTESRANILEQLTDAELMTMYQLALTEPSISPLQKDILTEDARNIFHNMPRKMFKNLMSCVYFKIYGRHAFGRELYRDILASLHEFKKKLSESPYACGGNAFRIEPNVTPCWDGHNLRAWNKHTGEVFIAKHAPERFFERVGIRKIRDPQRLLEKFRESFARAELTEIDPVEKVKSIINNNFKQAIYLLDKTVNIRFVLPETKRGEQLTIATVVRPR